MPRVVKPPAETELPDAVRIVRTHPELKSLAKARHRAVLIQPNSADRGQPEGADQMVVGLYDYETNRSLIALVDLKQEKVVAFEETKAQFQLSDEERKEAEALAAQDPRVKVFLGKQPMNPLTRLYFPPEAARDRVPHRYAIVFLRPNSAERHYAVVNLSERRVADVLTQRDLTGR